MPAGRPSKYSEEMQERADDYVRDHHGDVVPTAAGLACVLDVGKATIYRWAEEHPIFRDTLGALNAKQEKMLTNGGIDGSYNSAITKLMLANHGYSDKSENVNTLQGPGGEALSVVFNPVSNAPSSD